MTYSMQQESAQKLTTSLNPKADPDAVAAKKKQIETLLANNRSEIETGRLRVLRSC